jgi:hypothetical protein
MCGWALSSRPAPAARSIIRAKPAVVNGEPRSLTKTKGDDGLSRCSGGDGRSGTSRCDALRSGVDPAARARYAETGTPRTGAFYPMTGPASCGAFSWAGTIWAGPQLNLVRSSCLTFFQKMMIAPLRWGFFLRAGPCHNRGGEVHHALGLRDSRALGCACT